MQSFYISRFSSVAVLMVGLFVIPGLSQAVDGQILITQAKAISGGVTPGDLPGFPVTISQPGSYRLAGNLTVSNGETDGIQINESNVTLDLNGFSITQGRQGVESPAGAGLINITVTNGSVSNNSAHGIILRGENNLVEAIHADNNGAVGINAGGSSVIRRNTAYNNVDRGIQCDNSCTVEDNTALQNGGIGIRANGGVVTGNTATSNQGSGIQAGNNAIVSNNVAVSNTGDGIDAGGGTGSTVLGNTVTRNTGFGLRLTDVSGYASNTLTANNGGDANPQVLGGIEIGTNVCGTDKVCP